MDKLSAAFPIFFIGLLMVTFIDVVGSILSRKFRFNYGYLSFLSFVAYTLMGYWTTKPTGDLIYALVVPVIVGMYDATVGWWISHKLNAYWGSFTEEELQMSKSHMLLTMLFVGVLFGFIGHSLA